VARRLEEGAQWRTDSNEENRFQGETWVLYFRTIRKSDGKRVEYKIPIGLVRNLPEKSTAWAQVERLHLAINPVDSRRGVTFGDLALHYAEHELVERSESIYPKAHTTIIRIRASAPESLAPKVGHQNRTGYQTARSRAMADNFNEGRRT
jgi:hypothetical protein